MPRQDHKFWERAVREVERGAEIADVALRFGVRPKTLAWWRWNLGREERPTRKRTRKATFLPVVVNEHAPVAATLVEIETDNLRIRVQSGSDVQYVAALVHALRSTC